MGVDEAARAGAARPRRGRNPRKEEWTDLKRRRFLDHLAGSCDVREAAEAARTTEQSALALRSQDQQFAERWDAALATGEARLRGMLIKRCLFNGSSADDDKSFGPDPSTMDVELALRLLAQHRRGADGSSGRKAVRQARVTQHDTDAAILKQLKALAAKKRTR